MEIIQKKFDTAEILKEIEMVKEIDHTKIYKEFVADPSFRGEFIKARSSKEGEALATNFKINYVYNMVSHILGKYQLFDVNQGGATYIGDFKALEYMLIVNQIYKYDTSKVLISELVFANVMTYEGKDLEYLLNLKKIKASVLDLVLFMYASLKLDVLFPVFVDGDNQETYMKGLGFVDCSLKCEEGQRLLIKKYNII